jgi:hypothetical protein
MVSATSLLYVLLGLASISHTSGVVTLPSLINGVISVPRNEVINIPSNLTITASGRLEIDFGCTIFLAADVDVIVDGALRLLGTRGSPIFFVHADWHTYEASPPITLFAQGAAVFKAALTNHPSKWGRIYLNPAPSPAVDLQRDIRNAVMAQFRGFIAHASPIPITSLSLYDVLTPTAALQITSPVTITAPWNILNIVVDGTNATGMSMSGVALKHGLSLVEGSFVNNGVGLELKDYAQSISGTISIQAVAFEANQGVSVRELGQVNSTARLLDAAFFVRFEDCHFKQVSLVADLYLAPVLFDGCTVSKSSPSLGRSLVEALTENQVWFQDARFESNTGLLLQAAASHVDLVGVAFINNVGSARMIEIHQPHSLMVVMKGMEFYGNEYEDLANITTDLMVLQRAVFYNNKMLNNYFTVAAMVQPLAALGVDFTDAQFDNNEGALVLNVVSPRYRFASHFNLRQLSFEDNNELDRRLVTIPDNSLADIHDSYFGNVGFDTSPGVTIVARTNRPFYTQINPHPGLPVGLVYGLIQEDYYPGGEVLASGTSWLVLGDITVNSDRMLTIQPGVQLYMESQASFQIQGSLRMRGEVEREILVSCRTDVPAGTYLGCNNGQYTSRHSVPDVAGCIAACAAEEPTEVYFDESVSGSALAGCMCGRFQGVAYRSDITPLICFSGNNGASFTTQQCRPWGSLEIKATSGGGARTLDVAHVTFEHGGRPGPPGSSNAKLATILIEEPEVKLSHVTVRHSVTAGIYVKPSTGAATGHAFELQDSTVQQNLLQGVELQQSSCFPSCLIERVVLADGLSGGIVYEPIAGSRLILEALTVGL